jgi:transcriptional regulator with PAS, ATPase and Fis domain
MENYNWPGNVREMENVIERVVALTDGEVIDCHDLPPQIAGTLHENDHLPAVRIPEEGLDLSQTMAHIEKHLIQQAMDKSHGVKARAASLLNINRTTLVEKIKRYDM